MSVTYTPQSVREYYAVQKRLQCIRQQYEDIDDPEERTKFHEEHWADLKAYVEPPPLNPIILEEFMESYERFTHHFASALREFGRIPEGHEKPQNAATLWKAMVHGLDRVADALTKPPEK